MPFLRYRAYHVEKARGGVGLTMIGGSALVSRDSAPAFGNLQLWKDEAEPWLRRLADEVHEQGAAVMAQLTHLGHRTGNYTDNWLPVWKRPVSSRNAVTTCVSSRPATRWADSCCWPHWPLAAAIFAESSTGEPTSSPAWAFRSR
ncbi:hypothetical protein [Streptomyces sp. ME19-01-6]|uniref:oxidoreductase n=1 Tax=Streptomyces sp. ME19-01-6 TaxID=3028686 RepID=UPI0029BA1C87|nr:hypothetical protein [Streptomyces sp. ME19-01-6]MDX3225045.1 hypothetical protein [Streptomyces sp. ME19-01-6]